MFLLRGAFVSRLPRFPLARPSSLPNMPRTCTICHHPERVAIDQALIDGIALRAIAGQHAIAKSSLARHAASHLPEALARSRRAAEEVVSDDLVDRLMLMHAQAEDVLHEAREAKDGPLQLAALARLQKQMELEARLLGELREASVIHNTQINVLVSAEWLELRGLILRALAPHPEAAAAVVLALGDGQ